MPALTFLGRSWAVGSDDFVGPGLFSAVLRLVMAAALFVVAALSGAPLSSPACSTDLGPSFAASFALALWAFGACLVVACLLSLWLAHESNKGTVLDDSRRGAVPWLLLTLMVFGTLDWAWAGEWVG